MMELRLRMLQRNPSILPLHPSRLRIGYLVPEFPGQTHIFFWREIAELQRLGIELDIVSTRLPNRALLSHTWTSEAIERTTYLTRPTPRTIAGTISMLFRLRRKDWKAAFRLLLRSTSNSPPRHRLKMAALFVFGLELASLARRRAWSHIHVHSCADAANIAMFSRAIGGPDYSLTLHGALKDYGPNQANKWHNAAFGIVITRQLLQELRRELPEHAPATIAVAPMGVDVNTMRRASPYQAWRNGPVRLFCCGRLNVIKGHDDLIRSIRILADQGWDVHLRLAGQDDAGGTGYRLYLEKLIDDLGLQSRVTLLGSVAENVVISELENAHLFCLASIHEPLGVAIMEAMAMEVPVVVTRSGGVPELVEHGVDGWMVEPRSPQRLADAIAHLLQTPALARALAHAGREKVIQDFRSDKSARVLADLLGIAPHPDPHPDRRPHPGKQAIHA